MKLLLLTCFLILVKTSIQTEDGKSPSKNLDVTKLEVIDLKDIESDLDANLPETLRKRDSSYTYNRPDRFTTSGNRFQSHRHRGKISSRYPSQINRPFNRYGPPSHNSALTEHRFNTQSNNHHGQSNSNQFSNSLNNQNSGLLNQEVPSPIRNLDFVEPSPIASQNSQPFGVNTANYLPPQNQKLPAYSSPNTFSPQQNTESQNFVQLQNQQISDAAFFLMENAGALSQLYGAPAPNENYAPSQEELAGVGNQISSNQLQHFESSTPTYQGSLPSYASGTLNPQETLEQIQSLEKDRLIAQLQHALVAQNTENVEGRYAQNFGGNLQMTASDESSKFTGLNPQEPNSLNSGGIGTGNSAFGQTSFLPGSTTSFPLRYGPSTIQQTTPLPTTTTIGSTTTTTTQSSQGTRGDGTSQVSTSLPAPGQTLTPGFPQYGGFVPIIPGTNFLTNVPTYGTSFLTPITIGKPLRPSETSPTHFGIPFPSPDHKPLKPTTPSTTSSPPANHDQPNLLPANNIPLQPVQPVRPIVPVQPVIPLHPAVQTPPQATFGVQPAVINPFVYKPIKPVYPVYYYQIQKPTIPTHPWSYAPSYLQAQTKPAQIWK